MSVWAPPEQINQGQFALDVAVKVLQYYEDTFKVAYPLPKQGKYNCTCLCEDSRPNNAKKPPTFRDTQYKIFTYPTGVVVLRWYTSLINKSQN